MGDSINKRHPKYFRIIENFWGKQTDYISIPIEEGRSGYSRKVQNKIRIIPQGFDFDSIRIDTQFVKNIHPRFAYTGNIFPGYRDPTELLSFLCTLQDLKFEFIVYTRQHSFYEQFKEKLREKLVVKDYVSREQLIFELSQMDFLINLKNGSQIQAPSKLIDFYLSKRPIIDISTSFSEHDILTEFLNGNYIHQHKVPDIAQYDIKSVGKRFIELYEESY